MFDQSHLSLDSFCPITEFRGKPGGQRSQANSSCVATGLRKWGTRRGAGPLSQLWVKKEKIHHKPDQSQS